MLVAIGSINDGRAQISPGPLARAHEALDTAGQCFQCHGRGDDQGLDRQCRSCHGAIDAQLAGRQGLHGRERLEECSTCHPDHAGREFELIEWSEGGPERFDHARTGWALIGAHAAVDCLRCHRADFRKPGFDEGSDDSSPTFLGLDRSCATCHADPHGGAPTEDCLTCHGEDAWRPAPGFDHDRSRFSLTGRHEQVACKACHATAQFRPQAHQECSACHQDVHAGRFGEACSTCHATASFKIVVAEGFDHALTRYPLTGRHAVVPCAACHAEPAGGPRPAFATCGACHGDAHAGTATLDGAQADCSACHVTQGFRPSTFSAEAHRRTAYPLEGRHAAVACSKCHRDHPDGAADPALGTAGIRLHPAAGRCADCHSDAHGGQLAHRPDANDCEACHSVAGFRPSSFSVASHARLALGLDGAHAAAPCAACHGPLRQDLPPLPDGAALGSAGIALSTLDPACAACHFDPHEGSLAGNAVAAAADPCGACHTTVAFAPSTVTGETHGRFDFALAGAHLATPCFECHAELTRPRGAIRLRRADPPVAALPFSVARFGCIDCHLSPHGDQFAGSGDPATCERCHGMDAFVPAARFDHARDAGFSLVGAHASVPCGGCHPALREPGGAQVPRYRPTPRDCKACHASGTTS